MQKRSSHSQTTNFRLFQDERVCRKQFQVSYKWQKISQKQEEKHCGKKEKLLVLSNFSFSLSVLKKTYTCTTDMSGLVWEMLTSNNLPNIAKSPQMMYKHCPGQAPLHIQDL